ncbi:serine protease Do [Anaerobacterium chartisolvens]|uniref:Serine protease Do n=1 Tax=Anaerobacterium chartisolvens TaxID=1297424 RepID=A0A369B8I0_9FIRM|nr:trypsin-like peptidase domain-containing protein [Anaerobacterium chartisolvens]RCX16856.1 serine protease Do [Anaerobacterium chartisolvens]
MKKRQACVIATAVLAALFIAVQPVNSLASGISIFVNNELIGEAGQINGELYIPAKQLADRLEANMRLSADKKALYIERSENKNTTAQVISKVSPSVVGIIGNVKPGSSSWEDGSGDGMAFGTGVIFKSNGYIITNAHVVQDMENIIVVLSNGKAYQARLKALDDRTDLAVIKIDKGALTPAVLGDVSDIQVGEEVIAIGTPLSLSLRNSATKGIISGLNRSIQSDYKFIQSDAAINGGNSGGPIVNMQGKVIGINSVKYTGIGVEGLTFSIPVDTVKYAIDHFMKYGEIRRPYLGVLFMEGIAARYGLPSMEGLTVTEVEKGSPAEKSGLMADDIILSIDGEDITAIVDFNEKMKSYLPGSTCVFKISRDDVQSEIKVTFGDEKAGAK